jgi:ELWxxDGT repeat protein
LRARFGLSGHDRQPCLPGTDPAALSAPDGLDTPPHPDALAPETYTPGADGTETLFDGRVTAAATGSGPFGSSPYGFAALGDGRALFGAKDGTGGSELWVTDGSAAGTTLLKDVEPGYGIGFFFCAAMPVVGGTSWRDAAG